MRLRWETACALAIVALAAWLRLQHLGLAQFNDDQAIALRIAHDILHGDMRTTGLTSSSGAANPPLYVYIVAAVVAIHHGLIFATVSTAVLSVVAVALTYVLVLPRFGGVVALTTTALFATAPWAVLYGRHLWQQDYLPLVTVLLLWSLFVVLERDRTRVALVVPVLFATAFQLNLSAVALVFPIAAVLAYRARDVNWRAVAVGVAIGVVSLGSWLAHNAKHGFRDFRLIVDNGRGHGGTAGGGAIEAIRQTIHLVSAEGWTFVTGPRHQEGAAWTLGRAAGIVVIALLVLGIVTTVVRVVRNGRHPQTDTARRALLVVWLVGLPLSYVTSSRSGVGPHYLIVAYPVSFLLAALGLVDAASLLRRRPAAVSLAAAAAIAAGFVAFSLSFQSFVQRQGGTAGTYGVIYDDTAALAAAGRADHIHVDLASAEYLAWGHVGAPPGTKRIVTVRDRLVDSSPLPCTGRRRRFGPIEACFPR
ncbi:MAG TPA: glycosyltransferase family 39 protein [Gaiellaceae bacterium]|nr:glycosyltransferase family 39 protein [Gaiellaceae bacterium]